jgi:methylmalonyl-CoA mutase cobalamin-binding subunit
LIGKLDAKQMEDFKAEAGVHKNLRPHTNVVQVTKKQKKKMEEDKKS